MPLPWIQAAVGGGSALLGGLFQDDAAKDAQAAQAAGLDKQIGFLERSREQELERTRPREQASNAALAQMMQMVGLDNPIALRNALKSNDPTAQDVPEYLPGHMGSPLNQSDFSSIAAAWPTIRTAAQYSDINQADLPQNISPHAADTLANYWGNIREAANFSDINWTQSAGYAPPSNYSEMSRRWQDVYGSNPQTSSVTNLAGGGPTYLMGEAGKEDYYKNGAFTPVNRPQYVEGQNGYVIPRAYGGMTHSEPKVGPVDNATQRMLVNAPTQGRAYGGPVYRAAGGELQNDMMVPPTVTGFGGNTQPNVVQGPQGQTGTPSYDIKQDPSYQFRLDEGMRALESSGSAKGGVLSSGFARQALRYAQDYASTEYSNIYNRLSTIAGYAPSPVSPAYTLAAGDAMAGQGANAASGAVARGNARTGALSDAVGAVPWEKIFK